MNEPSSDNEKAAGQGSLKGITLEDEGTASVRASEATRTGGWISRGPYMRFSYANGDQPLAGYTIKRGVGVGGFGEVYYAVSDAGKEVALKRVQRNIDIELRGVRHCLNLKSPNLVALYDIRRDEHNDVWIVMEYVQGESLKDAIERHPQGMPRDELLKWFTAVVEGVAHLHDCGIVHRDLKPGNIFNDLGTVKVGDYGLSKFISCSRRDGHTESVGTIHYMAPEIGKGEYGKEIDIYALGVILYEMATGDVPFNGESAQEILFKHLTSQPDLSRLEPALRPVVARCLHKDPQQRFSDVREIVTAMQGIRAAGDAPLPPVSPTPAPPEPVPAGSNSASPPSDPIAAAVAGAWLRFRSWWYTSKMGKPMRVAIVAGAVALAIINAEWLVPTVLVLCTIRVMYVVARSLSLPGFAPLHPPSSPSSSPAPGGPFAPTPPGNRAAFEVRAPSNRPKDAPPPKLSPHRRRMLIRQRDAAVRRFLASRPLGAKAGKLLGSAVTSILACAALTLLVTSFVSPQPGDYTSAAWWAPMLWTTWVSAVGTWMLLVLQKRWEHESEQDSPRRFVQFFAGLLLGIVAFGLSRWLMFDVASGEFGRIDDFPSLWIPDTMYGPDGAPLLAAFLVYFGSLLLLIRWWRLGDPLRSRGFRIGRVIIAGLAGVVLAELWRFPQPWGALVAINMAVALQIASPWISPARRESIASSEIVPARETESTPTAAV